jgi:hypothetical protein
MKDNKKKFPYLSINLHCSESESRSITVLVLLTNTSPVERVFSSRNNYLLIGFVCVTK